MTTATPSLDTDRISLTPAAQVAAREQDACAVLAAMLTGPNAAHYQALRRACRAVSTADVITTARLLERCRQANVYLSADPIGRSMIENLAMSLAFLSFKQPYTNGYTFIDLINYGQRIGGIGCDTWAALFELATSALIYDTHNALTF